MGVWTNLKYLKKNHYVIWQQNKSLSYIKKHIKYRLLVRLKKRGNNIYIYTCKG